MVKRLPTIRETQVQSLGWEDLLEKEMATHSNILAWKIPWAEEPGRLQSTGSESDTTQWLHFPFPDMHQQYSRQTSFILWWNITLQWKGTWHNYTNTCASLNKPMRERSHALMFIWSSRQSEWTVMTGLLRRVTSWQSSNCRRCFWDADNILFLALGRNRFVNSTGIIYRHSCTYATL